MRGMEGIQWNIIWELNTYVYTCHFECEYVTLSDNTSSGTSMLHLLGVEYQLHVSFEVTHVNTLVVNMAETGRDCSQWQIGHIYSYICNTYVHVQRSALKECPEGVPWRSAPKECPEGMPWRSVLKECHKGVPWKCDNMSLFHLSKTFIQSTYVIHHSGSIHNTHIGM